MTDHNLYPRVDISDRRCPFDAATVNAPTVNAPTVNAPTAPTAADTAPGSDAEGAGPVDDTVDPDPVDDIADPDPVDDTVDPDPVDDTVDPDPVDDIADPEPIDVLHVEPDPRSAELLAAFAAYLSDRISVRSVGDAEAALAAVDDADCVVTEQRLPVGSGVDLVERLRRDGESLPVVFHTTHRGERMEARAFGAGADAYFEKRSVPRQYERILDRVRTLVDRGDTRRAASVSPPRVDGSSTVSNAVRSEE